MITGMVSIIITCHNYGEYLGQCVTSVLHQTYPEDKIELIVVDDASDDWKTMEQLDALSSHCMVIQMDKRHGLAASANAGIKAARGEFVMRLDADDFLAVHHIEYLMDKFATNTVAVHSDYWPFENGKIGNPVTQSKIPLGSCMIFRKVAWQEIGGYDEDLNYQEDVAFWKKLTAYGHTVRLTEPTWYYRRHDKQMSRNHNAKMKVREEILEHTKVLTVIPARGNSKGIERKNLQKVGGLTLVERAIRMVKKSGITTQLVVSTEDPEIKKIALAEGIAVVIDRPKILTGDQVSTIPVVEHAMHWIDETAPSWSPTSCEATSRTATSRTP